MRSRTSPGVPYNGPVNGSLLYSAELYDPMPDSGIELKRKGLVAAGSADADAMYLPDIKIKTVGDLCAAMEISYKEPNVTTTVYLYENEKLLRFKTKFIPTGKRYRLRAAFPTSIKNGTITMSIPCGHIERKEGEYPAQNWIEYKDSEKGVCLINKGLPGNNVTDGVIMLSLFRAVAMEDQDTSPWFEEGIEHLFEYALRPFTANDDDYNPERLGYIFNSPIRYTTVIDENKHSDTSPFIHIKSPNAEIMSCRQVEEPRKLKIRFFESHGKESNISIALPDKPTKCEKTDFMGTPLKTQNIKIKKNMIVVPVHPFEIVNLTVDFI